MFPIIIIIIFFCIFPSEKNLSTAWACFRNAALLFSDSLTAQQVVEELDLTSLKGRQWYIQSASARTGEGLMDAMEQFTSMVKELKERAS